MLSNRDTRAVGRRTATIRDDGQIAGVSAGNLAAIDIQRTGADLDGVIRRDFSALVDIDGRISVERYTDIRFRNIGSNLGTIVDVDDRIALFDVAHNPDVAIKRTVDVDRGSIAAMTIFVLIQNNSVITINCYILADGQGIVIFAFIFRGSAIDIDSAFDCSLAAEIKATLIQVDVTSLNFMTIQINVSINTINDNRFAIIIACHRDVNRFIREGNLLCTKRIAVTVNTAKNIANARCFVAVLSAFIIRPFMRKRRHAHDHGEYRDQSQNTFQIFHRFSFLCNFIATIKSQSLLFDHHNAEAKIPGNRTTSP